ncbi:MAG: outer membrane protein assembly factor BamD [Verrucomicrobia bacterium]|nr:outer membrane protein assembly factor BamD [Verrucomicrobiota bacterium]
MKRSVPVLLVALVWLAFPTASPAPLIYRPGEGWTYEPYGSKSGAWQRKNARLQLEVAQGAFEKKDYGLAAKCANHLLAKWPESDFAPQAYYLLGRCLEAKGKDEQAFQSYQNLIEKYPKVDNYQEVLKRQFEIANRYLAGQKFKIAGLVPYWADMDKTAALYEKVIKNGPYSEVAPQAQLNIGAAREKQTRFLNNDEPFIQAVKAYEKAADRYNDNKSVAADALFKAGQAYAKQARTAEYDQSAAAKALAAFTDFTTLYPGDARVPEAQKAMATIKTEQARGALTIARYYDKQGRRAGALVYYNEVLIKDPNSPYAIEARARIETLKAEAALQALDAPPPK